MKKSLKRVLAVATATLFLTGGFIACSVDGGSDDSGSNQVVTPDNPSVVTKYTVTFKNGDEVFSSSDVVTGSAITAPSANPSKDYYDFKEWRLAGEDKAFDFSTKITKETVLVAYFEKHEYTFEFDLNGGAGDAPDSVRGKIGETVALPNFDSFTKTAEAKTFTALGWALKADEENSGSSGTVTVDAETIASGKFYLVWTDKNVFAVTFVNDEDVVTKKVVEGSTVSAPAAPVKAGYEFKGWDGFSAETPVTAEASYNASWEVIDYAITYNDEKYADYAAGESNPSSYNIESPEITLASPSKAGYKFLGWFNSDNLKVEKISAGSTGELTLTAKWEVEKYAITYVLYDSTNTESAGNAVNASANPKEYTIESDDIVLADATSSNYKFEGWFNTEGTKVEKIAKGTTGTITLKAKWSVVAVESVSLNKSSAKVSKNGTVQLTATVLPKNATDKTVTWSATGNASVDANGLVAVTDVGSATITAKAGDKTAACSIEIVEGISVEVVKAEGWLNSAYVIFRQVDGIEKYTVQADGKAIDEPLIRFYDTYTYYENEDNNGQTVWTKKTFSKVVRADALGLKSGSHEITITPNSEAGAPVSETLEVKDHDRSGFAFTGSTTPGAYKADGTLKDGAVVIYLTQANKKTLTATIGGKSYTGIQDITQALKKKNSGSTAYAIRIVGTVIASSNDLSCADMKSAYALGVKGANEVTIEGVGHDATLFGAGVAAFQSEYVEISNLGLIKWGGGKDGDGVSLKADSYAWVHNCDYFYGNAGSDADQKKGDGSMDLKDDSNHVTISYNHFWDSGKMSLCGMKSESGPNYITYHHNWFDHSDSRHPRIRTMTVHVYNNYFDGNSKYGVGVTYGSSCFVEGNYFRNANDPMMSSKQGTDARGSGTFSGEKGGVIKSWNNLYTGNKNWAGNGGVTDPNGRKINFITNKYDYTNGVELGEYREWTETVGTENSDGTWTIYDSKVSSTEDTIATNSLIAIEDAANKGGYYQISKGNTGFYIDVPANVTKVIVKAKCGSSGKSGTSNMLSVNGQKFSVDLAADYTEYEATVSVSEDSTIEIANADSNCSMNVREIKVIAASGWETKLTSGADLSNIDAYEVDSRSETVPDNVTAKSGGATYSNFDTAMGDRGLGIANAPTDPTPAKDDVMKYAGRHESDYAFQFTNSADDESYSLNEKMNSELEGYTTCMTKIQGTAASSSGSSDNEEPETPETPSAPSVEGTVTCNFASGASSNSAFTTAGTKATGKGTVTVNGTEYTVGWKLDSSGSISFTTTESKKMTVYYIPKASGKDKLHIDDDDVDKTSSSGTACILTKTLAAGTHKISKANGCEAYVYYISLE